MLRARRFKRLKPVRRQHCAQQDQHSFGSLRAVRRFNVLNSNLECSVAVVRSLREHVREPTCHRCILNVLEDVAASGGELRFTRHYTVVYTCGLVQSIASSRDGSPFVVHQCILTCALNIDNGMYSFKGCIVAPQDCSLHGTCVDGDKTFTCKCDAGFVGDDCATPATTTPETTTPALTTPAPAPPAPATPPPLVTAAIGPCRLAQK